MFKIKRQPTRLALFLRWARFFFLVVGVLALSYCAIVLLDRWAFQAYQTWRFERALKDAPAVCPRNVHSLLRLVFPPRQEWTVRAL